MKIWILFEAAILEGLPIYHFVDKGLFRGLRKKTGRYKLVKDGRYITMHDLKREKEYPMVTEKLTSWLGKPIRGYKKTKK